MLRGAVEMVAPEFGEIEVRSEEHEKERFENTMERDVPWSPRCTFPQGDEAAWVDDGRTESGPKDSRTLQRSDVSRDRTSCNGSGGTGRGGWAEDGEAG